MRFFKGNKPKPYQALSAEEKTAHIATLEQLFQELWNENLKQLYLPLMVSMGQDFTLPSTVTEQYKQEALFYAQNLKHVGYTDDNPRSAVYEIGKGLLYANHNEIKHTGEGFDAKAGDAMAFLAVHDGDMIEKGITLEGSDYEKSILQLSIQKHDPNIKIHNKIAGNKLDPRAVTEFNAYQAAKTQRPTLSNTGPSIATTNPDAPSPMSYSYPVENFPRVFTDNVEHNKNVTQHLTSIVEKIVKNPTSKNLSSYWGGLDDAGKQEILKATAPPKIEDIKLSHSITLPFAKLSQIGQILKPTTVTGKIIGDGIPFPVQTKTPEITDAVADKVFDMLNTELGRRDLELAAHEKIADEAISLVATELIESQQVGATASTPNDADEQLFYLSKLVKAAGYGGQDIPDNNPVTEQIGIIEKTKAKLTRTIATIRNGLRQRGPSRQPV